MAGEHTLAEPRLKITQQDLAYLHSQTNDPSKNQISTL